jgi:predicted secreted hydrolase
MNRRTWLLAPWLLAAAGHRRAHADEVVYPTVTPRPLVFPRDHGAHDEYRIEWWYLTGWLAADSSTPLGFQVTFFRTRTPVAPAHPSRFAARQLIIAHAAVADAGRGKLWHEDRIARSGFDLAGAVAADADVHLRDWRLRRAADDGRYHGTIAARSFTLAFTARPTQPILLQGEAGFSRKGPQPAQASYYYTQPQLAVEATVTLDGRARRVQGVAWLDHEWSSTLLDPQAAGWDWIGMNLDDGAALTAFQVRRRDSGEALFSYAALRAAGRAAPVVYPPREVSFNPLERWTSPHTKAVYPVAQRIRVGARVFDTQPLFADQELDSRATAGAVYWEGASRLLEAGRPVGRGYLEMVGYVAPMRL